MAKKILGIDIGYDQLKLALCQGRRVLKTAVASMPENLLREGQVTSPEAMSELIRRTMKENKIHANLAALVLPNEAVYVKNVEMPEMTIDQLVYNLPFEFNDYITGEVREYVFDYAVLASEEKKEDVDSMSSLEDKEGFEDKEEIPTMELLAVSTKRELLENAQFYLRKAGLKLKIAAPAVCSFISLIRARRDTLYQKAEEFCVLDMGYSSFRMYMFRGDRHVVTRILDIGLANLNNVLADIFGVDVHLAHTYLMSNYENCQYHEECMTSYENIAVELMRALNFYRFSNPDSTLSDMWLCGGGAVIKPLRDTIVDMLDIELHRAEELVPEGNNVEECYSFVQAIGITLQESGKSGNTRRPGGRK